MEAFNAKIEGSIRVVASRYSPDYKGITITEGILAYKNIWEQLAYLESILHTREQVKIVYKEAEYAILTNLGFWKNFSTHKDNVVNHLIEIWSEYRHEQKNNHL